MLRTFGTFSGYQARNEKTASDFDVLKAPTRPSAINEYPAAHPCVRFHSAPCSRLQGGSDTIKPGSGGKRRGNGVTLPSWCFQQMSGFMWKSQGESLDLQIPPEHCLQTLPPTSDIPEPPLELRGSRARCCEIASNDLRREKRNLRCSVCGRSRNPISPTLIDTGCKFKCRRINKSERLCLYQLMTISRSSHYQRFRTQGPSLFLLLVSDSFPLHKPVFSRLFPEFVCSEREQSLNSLAGADWNSQGRLFTSLRRLCQSLRLSAGLPSFPLTLCLYMASLCLLSHPEMSLWANPSVIVSATSLFCRKLPRPPLFLWEHEEGGSFYFSPLR